MTETDEAPSRRASRAVIRAACPPPSTTTSPATFAPGSRRAPLQNETASTTPPRSRPGSAGTTPRRAPVATRIAAYSRSSAAIDTSFPTRTPVRIETPDAAIAATSAASGPLGIANSGTASASMPPAISPASSTVTDAPSSASRCAAASPAGPAPTTATASPRLFAATPAFAGIASTAARFRPRMSTPSSMEAREQARMHDARHSRPHADGSGLLARMIRAAASRSPRATAPTYAGTSCPSGHAMAHGGFSAGAPG